MDVLQILDSLGVPYDTSNRGKNTPGRVNIDCPFCGRSPYLGIHLERHYAFCWSCRWRPLDEVFRRLGMPEDRVREVLAGLPQSRKYRPLKKKHEGRLKLPEGIGPFLEPHLDYLIGRGFDPREIETIWSVMGIGQLGGSYRWRLFLPCLLRGKVVSWTTRSIGNSSIRYLSAPRDWSDEPIDNLLYGEDLAGHTIVVVEGPIDVWSIGPNAVGLFGQEVTAARMKKIASHPIRYVLLDSEREAQENARRLCRDLSCFPGITKNLVLESGNDPGSADADEVAEIRKLLV